MLEGEVLDAGKGDRIICIRSGQDGGPFVFDFEVDPGQKGPPMHSHADHNETFHVLEGELAIKVRRDVRVYRTGESITLTPSDPHTFWNPSGTTVVRCRVEHGGRFERAIVQPDLIRLSMYTQLVDPGSIIVYNRWLKGLMAVIARFGQLLRIKPVAI